MKKLLLASVASVVFAISSMALVPVDDLPKKAAYFTSWGQDKQAGDAFIRQANNSNLFEEAGNRIDALYLSFLRWDGLGNIKDDDLMFYSNDPTWKSGAYEDIRKIYASVNNGSVPGTRPKFIATFGGWTYAGMWDVMLDDATRETLARNLVALMGNKLGPAYNGYKDIVGFNIDGIEFDFERQVRISPALNDAFVKLVERIREIQTDSTVLREIGVSRSDVENDMIMLTTYHVGADPVECGTNPNLGPADGCSFVYEERSSHHGEVVRLLKNIEDKNLFDAYNIMLYDAGRTEVFHPEIAIDNYIKYLPPERVNGGITIKEQWGPTGNFTRSEALNHSFIKLFKEKGLNGYFTWSIGGATIDGVVNNSEEDINAHYRMAQVWENEIDAEPYEAEEFVASGTEFTVKTESILGQDHSLIQKDGKNYVIIGETSYEAGSDTVDEIPYIEIEEYTRNEWPGYASSNKLKHLCINGTRGLNAGELLGDKDYLYIKTRNARWCRSIDLPEASEAMRGKVIDVYRQSTWRTLVNGKTVPQWKYTRYNYK